MFCTRIHEFSPVKEKPGAAAAGGSSRAIKARRKSEAAAQMRRPKLGLASWRKRCCTWSSHNPRREDHKRGFAPGSNCKVVSLCVEVRGDASVLTTHH